MGFFGSYVNGVRYYIGFGVFRLSAVSLLMFYIPIYGAILYKYRNGGIGALLMSLVWLFIPVGIAFCLPNIVTAAVLMVSMLIQLTIAIAKGWYRVPIKRAIILAVNILDALAFSSEQKILTWKESEIRQWLNENFYETAFDRTEQTDILTTVTESDHGEHTEDKVYLLSQQEFLAYFGVSADALMKMSSVKENEIQNLKNLESLDSRIFTKGTQAALANGLWSWTEETTLGYLKFQNVDYSSANGNSAWWLRTADGDGPSAYTIAANGDVDSPQYVDSIEGVRPVIRIKR